MRNSALAADYVKRAATRLHAINVLFEACSWADVVCESQEVVELALKGLLRAAGVDPPPVHDVGDVLKAERSRMPSSLAGEVDQLAEASRTLRRDRELAFYGAEDLTPSDFFQEDDAKEARAAARLVVDRVCRHVLPESPD